MLDAVHKHPAGYPRHVQQSLQPQHAIGRAVPPASASVREGLRVCEHDLAARAGACSTVPHVP